MNEKNVKRKKNAQRYLESKAENNDAEVFVLPPNLLQKLGIDLENVKPSQDFLTDTNMDMADTHVININKLQETSPYNHKDKPHNVNDDNDKTEAEKETSILETAKLMKKSLFLSPTFIPTADNSLPGELEISKNQPEKSYSTMKLSNENHEIRKDYVEHAATNTCDRISTNLEVGTKSNAGIYAKLSNLENHTICQSKDNETTHVQQMNESPFINNVGGNIMTDIENYKTISSDEHPDEAYSSDYSNSNQEPLENINTVVDIPTVHSCNPHMHPKSNREINILSEEILGPTQLKKLKCLNTSHISNLIPLHVKALIPRIKMFGSDDNIADTDKVVLNNSDSKFQFIVSDLPSDGSHQTNLEAKLVYDDKVNMIQSTNFSDELFMTDKLPINLNSINADVVEKELDEKYNLITTKYAQAGSFSSNINKSLIDKNDNKKPDSQSSDNGFGVCIDMVVTDIENHLSNDVEILDRFVNKINHNDADVILKEMEGCNGRLIKKINSENDIVQVKSRDKPSTFFHSQCDKVHSRGADCINEEDIMLTSMHQNTGNNYFKRQPNISKEVGMVEKKPVMNTLIENEINIKFQNKDESDILKGARNSKPISIATQKYTDTKTDPNLISKQIKIKGSKDFKPRNIDSSSHAAGNYIKDVSLNKIKPNNLDDKVKIIANYLSQCTHLYKNKRKLKLSTDYADRKKMYINESNHKNVKLKLCFEGVEKPGGSEEMEKNNRKVFKTYRMINRRKLPCTSLPKCTPQEQTLMNSSKHLPKEIDCINYSKNSKSEEFCLCEDFGRFAYYERDTLYEHIHFWDHQNTICSPELIFSIYYDRQRRLNTEDVDLFNETVMNTINNELACDESIRTCQTICWNSLDPHNISHKNLEILSDKVSETVTTKTKQCINNTEMTTNKNKSMIMLAIKDNDQHEDMAKLTKFDQKMKTKDVDYCIVSDIKHVTCNNTVQPKGLPNLVETTMNENNCLTVVPENKEKRYQNTTDENDSMGQFNTSNEEQHVQSKDLLVFEDIKTNEVVNVTMFSVDSTKHHQYLASAKMNNLLNPVKIIPNISTDICHKGDLKNTEKRDSIHSKHVNDSGYTCESDTKKEKDEIEFDIQRNLVKTAENSEPKDVNDEINEEVTVDKNVCDVCTSDINFIASEKEIAEVVPKKGGKKRRKSFTKQYDKDDEPLTKKKIKCGVCKQLLVETEWENHIDKQHCFIAWKAGESIDFQTQELFVKLQQRLQSSGSLKCTFCDVEMKSTTKFLLHVQRCSNFLDISIKSESASEVIESTFTCGVCGLEVIADHWIKHISKEHNYLAWKAGEPALMLDDEELVRRHLSEIVKKVGALICSKCGVSRKYGKTYLHHVKNCAESENSIDNSVDSANCMEISTENTATESTSSVGVKCGVCTQNIDASNWITHIAKEHDYLAWKDGEPSLDLNDEEQIRQHLYDISKQFGGLNCSKCGMNRKYVKSYLHHLKNCNLDVFTRLYSQVDAGHGSFTSKSNMSLNTSLMNKSSIKTSLRNDSLVKCGVCQQEVNSDMWITHIQKYHNYLAWRDGETLNLENPEEVQNYLYQITKKLGGLTCAKCGIIRKYVKTYQSHIATCNAALRHSEENVKQENVTCGVCLEELRGSDWKIHRMIKHYNVAWLADETPVDINNPYAVERYLKEYKDHAKHLVCNICGISRVSYMGFYAHVLVCGKTEEEIEIHKSVCDICKKKYLCIYQNQHMAMHRDQVYARERKLMKEMEKANVKIDGDLESPTGRRKAAVKAKIVIENYKSNEGQYQHVCSTCGFGADSDAELVSHTCEKTKADFSDSDVSVNIESEESEDDSLGSEINSDISDDEAQAIRKRHKPATSTIVKRMPFTVKNPSSYLLKSAEDFCKFHFSDESLFIAWRTCKYEPVADDQLSMYLPPLEQSCNVKVCDGVWTQFKRFEAKKDKVSSIFVGASIQCVSWAPPSRHEEDRDNYLAVACHRGTDCPRFAPDVIQQHAGHIQIWDCGDFKQAPKLVFGLAHDFGTVWAMDWCPSGARDACPESAEPSDALRLGLLAVACSNGAAYIFSVPYPSTVTESDKLFYKLKPVVELRLSMGAQRPAYQATSLTWTPQNGHSFVVVGYGDGSTAYYDLNTDSPLLKTKENNVIILYPYHDERPHKSCVTSVDVYPSSERGCAGAVASSAPTGAGVASRSGGRAARLHSHLAASRAMFHPHWPSAILAGDDSVASASANELEWWGGGRRMGPVRACCACVRCARVAVSAPPVLRVAQPHPAYSDREKRTIGCLQMVQIGKKRKKMANDALATKIEPLTYDEAVKKYGIELKLDMNFQVPSSQARDQFPERFPLADVPSMAFCPTAAHHSKLAVATHAGVVFLLTV